MMKPIAAAGEKTSATIAEAYNAWSATKQWTFTLDYQRVVNPAYNRDRGPVSVDSLRVHWER
jgi:high affinity Mn2+ porin